jgi:PTH2 family peptidyl-tRNA hydrolase
MHKQVIVIRTDTEMRKGKMCGQVAHAAVTAFWKSANHSQTENRDNAFSWLNDIQTKVVCKVSSEAELESVAQKAEEAGLVVARIRDAGHTQLDPGTFTCVGIGPDTSERLDPITGELKLL